MGRLFMKSMLFKFYLNVMRFLAGIRPVDDHAIVILNGSGRSGSNGYLYYKYLKENHSNYSVTLVEPWPSSHLKWSLWKKIGSAKYVITTHQPFKVKKNQVNIQFWHGVPLKRMGIMANNTFRKDTKRNEKLWHKNADVVTSSSDLYETLMSACMAIETKKYRKLGFPRLDYLKKPVIDKQQFLQDLFHVTDDQAQVGIYMPTFRYELEDQKVMSKIKDGNFFAFDDFDGQLLNEKLKNKHQYLLVKLHPYEMRMFSEFKTSYSNIAFLNNSYLFDHNYDLYELLGNTDFLMTDFSSIYFDYLELERPIIFVTNFLKQYEKTRGLLMGPYQEITPGVNVNSQAELMAALQNLNDEKYQKKRQYWHDLTNQIQGEEYCQKVFDYMTSL